MKILSALLLLVLSVPVHAFDHSHAKWDAFLRRHVVVIKENSSRFKYHDARQNRSDLDAYVKEVEGVTKAEFSVWTESQKQAFLINAYNALTVKWILDNGIPKSIKDTGSLFKSPWKKSFFKLFGEETNLDHIEHDLARATWVNCRFHFAFNCASVGCPMLRKEAWLADRLDEQFDDSARRFVNDDSRNTYDMKSNSLQLSKIFDWYGTDFEKDKSCGGSVKAFVTRYMKKSVPENAKVKFLEYDWSLNKAE